MSLQQATEHEEKQRTLADLRRADREEWLALNAQRRMLRAFGGEGIHRSSTGQPVSGSGKRLDDAAGGSEVAVMAGLTAAPEARKTQGPGESPATSPARSL